VHGGRRKGVRAGRGAVAGPNSCVGRRDEPHLQTFNYPAEASCTSSFVPGGSSTPARALVPRAMRIPHACSFSHATFAQAWCAGFQLRGGIPAARPRWRPHCSGAPARTAAGGRGERRRRSRAGGASCAAGLQRGGCNNRFQPRCAAGSRCALFGTCMWTFGKRGSATAAF
jgi:hypothetical protein